MNKIFYFLEIFFQDYSMEDINIPSHWCVKYIENGKGFVDYSYHNSKQEAIEWTKKNCKTSPADMHAWVCEIGFDTGEDNLTEKPTFGATPPITPEEWFEVKQFNTIKSSRTDNLYEYFPVWFEELQDVEGVYLAGGSLRNLLGGDDVIQDIDLFFRDAVALTRAMSVMDQYMGSEDGCWYEAFRCPAGELITYKSSIDVPDEDKTESDYKNQKKVQFITKSFYESPEELINSFDFIPTCACLYKGILYTHPDWVKHVKKKTLGLHFVSYPVATLSRMMKYRSKGYLVIPETLLGLVEQINSGEFDGSQLALYVD